MSLLARKKMSSFFNQERENRIKENSLLENATNLCGYFEYTRKTGYFYLKWLYYLNGKEFLRKMYPANTEAEIKNSICIYLEPMFNEQSNDYGDFFLNGVRISRVCFCGRYLKTEIDHNYE